ncbi:radical SAM protein [Olsenella uli]|uniref:radical SAM protein n=1 Tax=Olsenella uli TaxID=133926 RepID=UPI0028D2E257|nr:radical SAM protein [Olsenella uli]
MQSKIAHAAERKAFGMVLDQIIKSASGDDREKNIGHLVDMAGKLLKDTSPGATRGIKKGLYPGSKWEKYLFRIIDETNPHVLKTAILNGGYEAAFRGLRTTTANAEREQCNVPWIILFDPTSACNKHCVGCWAADYGNRLNLTFDEMDRLVSQAKDLGTHLFMLTGGEPLVRKGDVLKLAEKHHDCLFNIFTNASLVDDVFCRDVQRLGNIVFSVSLESYEPSVNDGRRGDGSFEEVMNAFDLMHKYGLLYGTSTAYTRDNTERVSSDEFFDLIISKGCRFAWYFHYMPVGEGANADLMPTVEQREYMFRRIREIRGIEGGKPIFAMDFQNDGEFVGGCIAGGRVYCHVNARGDVEPCVFIHYSNVNIKTADSWLDCLKQPLFQAYRAHYPWNKNMLQPCPMLENPAILPRLVNESGATTSEYVAPESAEDLCGRTSPYARKWAPKAKELWNEMYPTGEKVYADEMSSKDVSYKAKVIAAEDAAEEAVVD